MDICAATIIFSATRKKGDRTKCNRLSEIKIEQMHGHLRSQFASANMTVRDYYVAMARLMLKYFRMSGMDAGELPASSEDEEFPLGLVTTQGHRRAHPMDRHNLVELPWAMAFGCVRMRWISNTSSMCRGQRPPNNTTIF